jgi:hypothetical protein
MQELLKKLIDERGTPAEDTQVITAQVVLDGGVSVQGAISWHPSEGYFRAISLVVDPRNPNQGGQMIESFFAPETVRTIMLPAPQEMQENLRSLFPRAGGNGASRILS